MTSLSDFNSPSYAIAVPYNPDDLLGAPRTAEYIPDAVNAMYPMAHNRPKFSGAYINEMLTDPRLQYALWLLKGPILSNAKIFVKCEDTEVKERIKETVNRFWRNDVVKALKAIEWGYMGAEVVRTVRNGWVTFDYLNDVATRDVRVVTDRGQFSGITVDNVPIGTLTKRKIFLASPVAFHHVHWKEYHPWYGRSRFHGPFVAWWEIWTNGGYRDIRRLWFFQNCFDGGIMRHPVGGTRMPSGGVVPNNVLAKTMLEKKRSGAGLAIPSGLDQAGNKAWEYEPPNPNAVPAGLLEYGKDLSNEELEGMGIPPEVIESGGDQGFGSATGRQVPQTAYYAVIQELLQGVVNSLLPIIRVDVAMNKSAELAQNIDLIPFPIGQTKDGNDSFNGNQFVNDDFVAPGQPGGPGPEEGQIDPMPQV